MNSTTISALIVDDEPLARRRIENLLTRVDEINVKGAVGTGGDAILQMNAVDFDLVFLDIQLKDMTGFQVLESLKNPPPLIIFVSAFDAYAIKAFDIFAFDYLLKPFTEERFYKSVQRTISTFEIGRTKELKRTVSELMGYVSGNPLSIRTSSKNRIPIPDKKKTYFVCTQDIQYITASNYYVEIYTENSKHILRDSMYNILDALDSNEFIRIHRSSIVNLTFITELVNSAFGEIDVKMSDGKLLRVSKGYRKGFLRTIGVKK